jgi:hypothetical protein
MKLKDTPILTSSEGGGPMVFIDDVRIKNRKFSFKTDNADPKF